MLVVRGADEQREQEHEVAARCPPRGLPRRLTRSLQGRELQSILDAAATRIHAAVYTHNVTANVAVRIAAMYSHTSQ